MPSFDLIPELDAVFPGRSLIRVPDQQNVPLTPRVRALIDTVEFQRLNEISQLGLVSRVYPGARHTRFEHALGVYHNALRYVQQLLLDVRFRERIGPPALELLIVSALLHDLGHWPFCHPIEDLGLTDLPPHEAHAARFLGPGSELADVLRTDWRLEPGDVLDILAPQRRRARVDEAGAATPAPPQSSDRKLLRSILSGPIDVDKLDYLDRDSWHCGVPYGRHFDRQRLIQSLLLNSAGDGLAITVKGKTAAELMVFARYVMFSEVYWHHAVRAATCMFARAFFELQQHLNRDELFELSDADMIAQLRAVAASSPCAELLAGLFGPRRRLFKQAAEVSHDQQPDLYQLVAGRPFANVLQIADRLCEEVGRTHGIRMSTFDLLIDAPPPHREVELAIDVYFPKLDAYRPLRTVSPVVEALATSQFDDWVKRVRVFVSPAFAKAAAAVDWPAALARAASV